MKTITLEIEEKDFEDLDIHSSNLSLRELDEKLRVWRIRKLTTEMRSIALQSEGYVMAEEEIFDMVNEIKKTL
jgi:hypothetical protein